MIGIDTNILMRCLINDDSRQNEVARAFLSSRSAEDPAFVSAIALAETIWVLRQQLKFPNGRLISVLEEMLATEELVMEFSEEIESFLSSERRDAVMIADHLIHWSGVRAGSSKTVTFDKRAAARISGMELLA